MTEKILEVMFLPKKVPQGITPDQYMTLRKRVELKSFILDDDSWDCVAPEVKESKREELDLVGTEVEEMGEKEEVVIEFEGRRKVADSESLKLSEVIVPREYVTVVKTLHTVFSSAVEVEKQFFPYHRKLQILGEDMMWQFEGRRIEEVEIPVEGALTMTTVIENELLEGVTAVREKIDGVEVASFAIRVGERWITFLWDDEGIQLFEGRYVAQYEKRSGVLYLLNGNPIPGLVIEKHDWKNPWEINYDLCKEGIILLVAGQEYKVVRNPTYTIEVKNGLIVGYDSYKMSSMVRDGVYDVDLRGRLVRLRKDRYKSDSWDHINAVKISSVYQDVVVRLLTVTQIVQGKMPRTRRKIINDVGIRVKEKGREETDQEMIVENQRYVLFRDCRTNHNKKNILHVIFFYDYYGGWY